MSGANDTSNNYLSVVPQLSTGLVGGVDKIGMEGRALHGFVVCYDTQNTHIYVLNHIICVMYYYLC